MKEENYTFMLGWCKTGDGTSLTKSFQRILHVLQFRLLTKNPKYNKIRSHYHCDSSQGKEGGEEGKRKSRK